MVEGLLGEFRFINFELKDTTKLVFPFFTRSFEGDSYLFIFLEEEILSGQRIDGQKANT